jgi:hypothetical protein
MNIDFNNLPIVPTILLCIFILYFFFGIVKFFLFRKKVAELYTDSKDIIQELETL